MWSWRARREAFEYRVLMVCAGNICRSPTAVGVLRQRLVELGLDRVIEVESAGTYPQPGSAPDPRASSAARRRGYELAKMRARAIVTEDFERFDLILAMDGGNLQRLREICPPAHHGKLALLLERGSTAPIEREVPDPYYGAPEGFERVLDLIEAACRHLAVQLQARAGR